jgi:hypothetical protein
LLGSARRFGFFLPVKYFHHAELLVGDGENSNMTFFGQNPFYSFDVDIGVFAAWAMAEIDGKLEHVETISHDLLAEPGSYFSFLFSYNGQIEKDQYPQDPVFV